MRKRNTKKNHNKIIGIVAIMIAVACGVVALYVLTKEEKSNNENKIIYDLLRSKIHKNTNDNIDTGNETAYDTIDWEALKGYPVVGWIKMGNYIDYPILQNDDNKYYLTHSYDGTYNANGSIFMNCNNNSDFMDRNTIIYGHNMRNKSMFGSIKDLLSASEDDPKEFYIYLPDGTKHTYSILSIDKVKDLGFAFQTSFGSLSAFDNYKDQMISASEYSFNVDKTSNKTVMLSTCNSYGSAAGNRVVVLGQEEYSEQIQSPASWYKKRNYIEINNTKAICLKDDDYYYIIQDSIAIRCIDEETVNNLIKGNSDTVIVRVEYEKRDEYLNYQDLNGKIIQYELMDIIDYEIE